jgi:hypothetical protein
MRPHAALRGCTVRVWRLRRLCTTLTAACPTPDEAEARYVRAIVPRIPAEAPGVRSVRWAVKSIITYA